MEFTTYAALLSGRSPSILHNCLVAQHRQTWKLREYCLVVSSEGDGITVGEPSTSLSLGDPLKAFFPPGIRICEHLGCAEVYEPGKIAPLVYRPSPSSRADAASFEHNKIQDILLLGEVRTLIILLPQAILISCTGSFCLGSIQYSWSGATLRWLHQSFEGICTFISYVLSCTSFFTFNRWRAIGVDGFIVGIWLVASTGTYRDAGGIRSASPMLMAMRVVSS